MKNFKEISELIKIGQTIEYNIMDWMNYYDNLVINQIEMKGFNEAEYLVLSIRFRDKKYNKQIHSLSVGIHKTKLEKYKNYEYIIEEMLDKITASIYGYIEKYGLGHTYNKIINEN
jgi:hypothetical protein